MDEDVSLVQDDIVLTGSIRRVRPLSRLHCVVVSFRPWLGPCRKVRTCGGTVVVSIPLEREIAVGSRIYHLGDSERVGLEKWYDDVGSVVNPFTTLVQPFLVDG